MFTEREIGNEINKIFEMGALRTQKPKNGFRKVGLFLLAQHSF